MKQVRIIRKVTFPGIEPEKIIPNQDLNEPFTLTGLTNTDQLPEGLINLYYTDVRVDARIALATGIGQNNTASNVGSGIGLFKQKTGVDLEFKSLLSSNKLTITPNVSGLTVDIDVNESNLTLNNIGGTLSANKGGTGFSIFGVGDLLFANTTTTLSKLPVSTDGKVLTLVGGLPSWVTPSGGGGGGGDISDGDNVGGGSEVFQIKSGSDLVFRTLLADSDKITITQNANTINFDIDETKLTLDNMIGPLGFAKGGTGLTTLGIAGQVLTVNGTEDALEWTTPGTGSGEANTASNLGSGTGVYGLFTVKSGVDLPFRSLFEDNGISIDDTDPNLLKISVYEQELDINLIGGTPLDADKGGTGFASFVVGDLLFANTISTFGTIGIGNIGDVLTVSGSNLPIWVAPSNVSNPDAPTWVKITKTYLDFTIPNTSNDTSLYILPIAGVIHAIKIKHSISFTGGGMTFYNISVGIVGELNKYITPFDVSTVDSDDNFVISNSFQSESHGFTTDIRISAESDVNLNTLSGGSVDVWLLISRAP